MKNQNNYFFFLFLICIIRVPFESSALLTRLSRKWITYSYSTIKKNLLLQLTVRRLLLFSSLSYSSTRCALFFFRWKSNSLGSRRKKLEISDEFFDFSLFFFLNFLMKWAKERPQTQQASEIEIHYDASLYFFVVVVWICIHKKKSKYEKYILLK